MTNNVTSTMTEIQNLTEKTNTAIEIAKAAGAIQKQHFGEALAPVTKASSIDIVTKIDLACDELIRTALQQHFPDDQILTEETFDENQTIDLSNTWVIDPLDGTTNYAHAFPYFAVSMAYFVDNQPVVGVVYNPIANECFYASKNNGCYLNEHKITVSEPKPLNQSLFATGFPYDVVDDNNGLYLNRFTKMLAQAQGIRRPGAAALDLAFVATGRLDGFWEYKLSPWDVAAGCLLITEAGGSVASMEGQPLNYTDRRIHIMAANSTKLMDKMRQVF